MEKHNITEPETFHKDIEGMSYIETAQYFVDTFQTLNRTREEVMQDWRDMAVELYATKVFPKPGAVEFLDEMKRRGVLLGIATSNDRKIAQAALDGIRHIHIFVRPSSRFYRRTLELADTINRTTSCRATVYDHDDKTALRQALSRSRLLINGTPVGMAPDAEHSIIEDTSLFHEDLIVSDLIYNPRKTRLMQLAESVGCKTFNGMYMLLYQGAESFRIWTGQDMPVDLIKQEYFS